MKPGDIRLPHMGKEGATTYEWRPQTGLNILAHRIDSPLDGLYQHKMSIVPRLRSPGLNQ